MTNDTTSAIRILGGLDLGYNKVKGVTASRRFEFASVTGTGEQSSFSVGEVGESIILTHPDLVSVGEQAIVQSKSLAREIDRDWISTDKWRHLFLASLSEMAKSSGASLRLVVGLPVSFYGDKAKVQASLVGQHTFQRLGRNRQTLTVEECRVIPQGFGAILAEYLNDNGKVANAEMAGRIGVIDVGGKTTGYIMSDKLRQVDRLSESADFGGWSVVSRVWDYLKSEYPGLTIDQYALVDHVISKTIKVKGVDVDLTDVVNSAADDLAMDVIGKARAMWNGAEAIDSILVCGGAANLVGAHILRKYDHARVVESPTFANAVGFYRFAKMVFPQ